MQQNEPKRPYHTTPALHNSMVRALNSLDETAVKVKRRRKTVKIALVCAVIIALGTITAVATATNLFGLISQPVGKYGLNLSVEPQSTIGEAAEKKHVKLHLGYVPGGYCEIVDEDGTVAINKYSYGGKPISDRWGFSFLIYDADTYKTTEPYIVASYETEFNGHKAVVATQKMNENDTPQYIATEYFEDWGYVVEGYCINHDELIKIMEQLSLEEDIDYSEPETIGDDDDPYFDYAYSQKEEFTTHAYGETFRWATQTVNGESNGSYSVTFQATEEKTNADGLDLDGFLHNENENIYYRYFDSDGNLIDTYERSDLEAGDGIDSLDSRWQTETKRRFFLVTVEVAGDEITEDFSDQILLSNLVKDDDGSYVRSDKRGNAGVIYQKSEPTNKPYTTKIICGVLIDEELLDTAYLNMSSDEIQIDDTDKTVERKDLYDCIKLMQ